MKSVILSLFCTLLTFMPLCAETVVEHTITVPASPLQVFNAFTADWQIRQWSGAAGVTVDAREGGIWRFSYASGDFYEGIYEIVNRQASLVFGLLVAGENTHATVDFFRMGDSTQVRIRHDSEVQGSARDSIRTKIIRFWDTLLPQLTDYLTRIPGSYIAAPPEVGAHPTVLVLHDRFGLNRTIRAYCDSLAASGYIALAVDMFKGDATSDITQAARYLELAQPEQSLNAARQAYQALLKDSIVQKNRIAVWGFGYGSNFALSLAAETPRLKACVIWQSAVLPAADVLRRTAAPVLGVFTDFDVKNPRMEIKAFDQTLVQAGARVETVILPGGRDFADPAYGESYSNSAISDGWKRSILFLDKQLRL